MFVHRVDGRRLSPLYLVGATSLANAVGETEASKKAATGQLDSSRQCQAAHASRAEVGVGSTLVLLRPRVSCIGSVAHEQMTGEVELEARRLSLPFVRLFRWTHISSKRLPLKGDERFCGNRRTPCSEPPSKKCYCVVHEHIARATRRCSPTPRQEFDQSWEALSSVILGGILRLSARRNSAGRTLGELISRQSMNRQKPGHSDSDSIFWVWAIHSKSSPTNHSKKEEI